jgi:hypothetical protein
VVALRWVFINIAVVVAICYITFRLHLIIPHSNITNIQSILLLSSRNQLGYFSKNTNIIRYALHRKMGSHIPKIPEWDIIKGTMSKFKLFTQQVRDTPFIHKFIHAHNINPLLSYIGLASAASSIVPLAISTYGSIILGNNPTTTLD